MRVKLEVDKAELEKAIMEVEADNTFATRVDLHNAVANTEWAKNHWPKPVTASVVQLRIAEFNIAVKTPKGKRGKRPGFQLSDEQKEAMRQGRVKNNNVDESVIKELRKNVPESYQNLVNKTANGSKSSAIKLMCLTCTCFQTPEIRHCTVKGCPLWSLRPYKINS